MPSPEKVIFINGEDVARLGYSAKKEFFLFNAQNFSSAANIGDKEIGFDYPSELVQGLSLAIDSENDAINIVLNMHGINIYNKNYSLVYSTKIGDDREDDGVIEAKNLFQVISENAPDKKINIFSLACYGAHLHELFDQLPMGSTLITLSTKNNETNGNDFYNNAMQSMVSAALESGNLFKYLLPLAMLCQKFTYNIPEISYYDSNNNTVHENLESYADRYFKDNSKNFAPIIHRLIKIGVVDAPHLQNLKSQIVDTDISIKSFHMPSITSILKISSNEEIIEKFEGRSYHVGGLKAIDLDFEKLKKFKEQYEALTAEILEHEPPYSKHNDNLTLSKYESFSIINAHSTNIKSTVSNQYDYEDLINQALPNHSLLLGVAAADLVDNIL